jgi:DMSO/TMAO reductase YedYZ molybdopterin-dependent catalytic subunit
MKGPFRAGAFRSRLHDERIASILGISLGVAFAICFLTGLYSHLLQTQPSWLRFPSRPAGLYRITQGLHVATGIAAIPLLFAKLWTVYPKLWRWPPVESVAHALERISLFPLVGGSLFLLMTGIYNTFNWYPWFRFSFPAAHYWAAWITIGSLIVHIGAKAGIARAALRRGGALPMLELATGGGLTRRGFLGSVAATSGLLTAATVGQSLSPLGRLAALAPRRPGNGPQHLPVNKSAREAHLTDIARDPAWRLHIEGAVQRPMVLSLDELRSMPLHEAALPITCVEGWSATGRWGGVRVRDLLERAGAAPGRDVFVESLQAPGAAYRSSILPPKHTADPDTLLALELNGEPLHIDHGYPARLIAPNRPGVLQTKWVTRMEVL